MQPSKGAIISMTYIAAHQLAGHDINVNAICPGLVETQMLNSMLAQRAADTGTPVAQLKEGLEQMIPLGRLDEPEDIAAMAVLLAGPGGRNITGSDHQHRRRPHHELICTLLVSDRVRGLQTNAGKATGYGG